MKLYLGTAVWREETVAYGQSMRLLWRELDKQGIPFTDGTVAGDALISRSRSIIASSFLRSDADVLLSIDSDIWFRPQDALKLAGQAEEYGIIAALYMTRNLNTQPALMLPDEPVLFHAGATPVEAQYVSTGFVAVHRRVFQTVKDALPLCHQQWTDNGVDTSFWPFYMPYVIEWPGDVNMYLSEDWAFCQRAKDAGFKCWVDPSIRLGHMGQTMYTMEDLIRAPKPSARPLKLLRDKNGELQAFTLDQVREFQEA